MLDTLFELSIHLTFWLQGLGGWLKPVMQFFTFLGNEQFYLFVMPILAWLIDYNLGARIGMMLLLTTDLNETLKLVFRMPRPYWVNPEIAGVASRATGYGMPSGHSQTSFSVFGLVAATFKKGWVTTVVVFTVLMVGLSRIYLGEHFFTDVLVGWLIGGIVLWTYLKVEGRVKAWFAKRSDVAKIGSIFVFSLVVILIAVIVVAIPPDYEVPQEWLTNAHTAFPDDKIDPLSIKNIVTTAGTLFGLATGVVWTQAGGGFAANKGAWWQRLLRFAVGLVGVLVFWMGLDMVFPDNGDLLSYILRYVRYALVGLWMAGGSIWTFIKLNIGERNT